MGSLRLVGAVLTIGVNIHPLNSLHWSGLSPLVMLVLVTTHFLHDSVHDRFSNLKQHGQVTLAGDQCALVVVSLDLHQFDGNMRFGL